MSGSLVQGQYYPELADPKVSGTILFFYVENMEFYQPQNFQSDEIEKKIQLINRLRIDLAIIEDYDTRLKIDYIDISQKRHVGIHYQVYGIPTVILFNRMGFEIRRWVYQDYQRGGGSVYEMKKYIEKMKNPTVTEE
jgi:hypothetical protein